MWMEDEMGPAEWALLGAILAGHRILAKFAQLAAMIVLPTLWTRRTHDDDTNPPRRSLARAILIVAMHIPVWLTALALAIPLMLIALVGVVLGAVDRQIDQLWRKAAAVDDRRAVDFYTRPFVYRTLTRTMGLGKYDPRAIDRAVIRRAYKSSEARLEPLQLVGVALLILSYGLAKL
jgi:hypothetical protein